MAGHVGININDMAWHGMLSGEQNPSLFISATGGDLIASLDVVQTLNSALNAVVCYVSIVWDVANRSRRYEFTVTHLSDSQNRFFSQQYQERHQRQIHTDITY